jgi:hypothetical protein
MPDAPPVTNLLIEVILPQDVARGIKDGSKYAVPTARSVPVRLRLSIRGGPTPPSMSLQEIWLRGESLHQRFPNQSVPLDPEGTGTVHLSGGTVLPYAGLFWLEAIASAPGYAIETEQRDLQGTIGRGWSEGGPKEHWRSPVIAVDVLALTQAKLNRTVLRLTIAVIVLGVFQLSATLCPWCPAKAIGPSPAACVPAPSSAPPKEAANEKMDVPLPQVRDPGPLR